jgi:putative ABC transport system substrate-binding protein
MMRRREFITGPGAAVWPVIARAQSRSAPIVGFLSGLSAADSRSVVAAFRQGLAERGYIDDQNNLKSAKAIGFQFPQILLARGDEVIE